MAYFIPRALRFEKLDDLTEEQRHDALLSLPAAPWCQGIAAGDVRREPREWGVPRNPAAKEVRIATD